MASLSYITANALARVKRTTVNGREWFVAPTVMIVPGILSGSKGALLYEPQECAANVSDWNDIPVTVNHPTDPLSNAHVSANSPGVIERQGIGVVKNAVFNGKLRSTVWIDAEKVRNVDPGIYNALVKGQSVEISTGLFTTNIPQQGSYKGRNYDYIARDYRPDHLAVLPAGILGACSLQDGCGLAVNVKKRDRTGSTDKRELVDAPKYNSRVVVEGHGPGRVENPGFTHATVELDTGKTVTVPHHELKRDVDGRFATNKKQEGCGDGG